MDVYLFVQIKGLEGEIERRTLTFSRWENSAKDQGQNGWHPVTFKFADATVQTIKEIQVICPLAALVSLLPIHCGSTNVFFSLKFY